MMELQNIQRIVLKTLENKMEMGLENSRILHQKLIQDNKELFSEA